MKWLIRKFKNAVYWYLENEAAVNGDYREAKRWLQKRNEL